MQWSILAFISILWLLQLHSCTFFHGPKKDKCVGTLVPLTLQLILITKMQNRMQRPDLNVQTTFWPLPLHLYQDRAQVTSQGPQ